MGRSEVKVVVLIVWFLSSLLSIHVKKCSIVFIHPLKQPLKESSFMFTPIENFLSRNQLTLSNTKGNLIKLECDQCHHQYQHCWSLVKTACHASDSVLFEDRLYDNVKGIKNNLMLPIQQIMTSESCKPNNSKHGMLWKHKKSVVEEVLLQHPTICRII